MSLALFFAAQDAAAAGGSDEAECLWTQLLAADCDGDVDGTDGTDEMDEPPACVVRSMAYNGLAELALDRALASGFPLRPCPQDQHAAEDRLRMALCECPANSTAAMSAALLAHDAGDAKGALALFAQAARAVDSSGDPSAASGWREDWLLAPHRHAAPLAVLYRALLLSQLGRHEEATPELQRLGFRWRLAGGVWECARTPRGGHERTATPDESDGGTVRLYRDAVAPGMFHALTRAFAADAAYWRETRYETAARGKRYFTFYVDLDELRQRSAPSHAIEALILSLLPLTGRGNELRACEWWVHRRASGRGWGHELHYDLEEAIMEASGRVVHPALSSVVYLSSGGDPTIILDETLQTPLSATRAFLAHPEAGSFLAFRGDLLHGVLPGPFAHDAHAGAPAGAPAGGRRTHRAHATAGPSGAVVAPRLTLLVAWYDEHTKSGAKRARLGAQASVPRPSRSQTWPRDLEVTEEERRLDADAGAASGAERAGGGARQVAVPQATPVWTQVPPLPSRQQQQQQQAGLTAPASLRQHFFLHEANEVGDRLRAEHGLGGSWSGAGAHQGRKRK